MFNFLKKDDKKPKKLWQQFKGRKNTEDILVEKAKALAPVIIGLSATESQKLKKYHELKNVSDDKLKELSYELIPFYIHCADRIAFQYFEPGQRKKFVIALFTEIRKELSSVCGSEKDAIQFKSTFTDTFFNRQEEYSKYEMSPDKDSGNKDGLLMNFSMKATDILGYKTDMRIVMYIFMTISSSLSTFQLPELFQD
jgi:hypothetical protein